MGAKVIDFSTSVIIPAYNAERTIIRALDSVRNQSVASFIVEVVVVNDGSTDETKWLVEQYQRKHENFPVKLIDKKNGGVSTARNMGLQVAKGYWIALLDSDDEWYPNKLQMQFEVVQDYMDVDFIGGNHTDQVIRVLWKTINQLYKPSVEDLCIKMFPQTSTVLFKKKIFDEIGGFDETRKYGEDGQFFMKICEKYNYYYMPEQLITFDGGKRGFGMRGLSQNLKSMQDGCMKNLKELYERKSISLIFYLLVFCFSQLKYFRRLVICKLEK